MTPIIDLSVLIENLRDPDSLVFGAMFLTGIAVVYALLSYWLYLTEPEDDDE